MVEWVGGAFYPATGPNIAGRLEISLKGTEKWSRRFGQWTFFFFDGIDEKHQQRQALQTREDRVPSRLPAELCSLCWWKPPLAWWTRFLHGGHCKAEESTVKRVAESGIVPFRLTALMTDRKKSREGNVLSSSCVRVIVCPPGPRLVFDQSIL